MAEFVDDLGLLPTAEKPPPDFKDDLGLISPFEQLKREAKPRADLGVEKPVFTYAGRVATAEEKPEDVLKRTPQAELEAGSLASTAPYDLAFGLAVGRGLTGMAAHPRQTVDLIRGIVSKYRTGVESLGEYITSKVPKVFRAGRGTPLEFREARAQMEADIGNRVDQAVALGKELKQGLTVAERMRADQLLRGGITTGKTPEKVAEAVKPVRAAIDEIQKELIELGRLSPETVERFQENFGPYLARLYSSKEFVGKEAVLPFPKPTRAGTERLLMRGDRVTIEIPSLEQEMNNIARLIGPEREFRRVFRERARELTTRRETTTTTQQRERTLGEQRTTERQTSTTGGEGEFTQVPLTGVAERLERVVTEALQTRGMTAGEAAAAVGRVKAAAVRAAQGGPEVTITGGGTTKETVKETVRQTVEREKETVKEIIQGLGINKAQQAALHAYYDTITRAAMKTKSIQAGGKTYRVAPIMDPDSGIERVDSLRSLLRDGWIVESREGNKVTMFRDIPEAQRKAMGELRSEPGYVAAKSIAQTGREAAVVRFFRKVASNPEWSSPNEVPGWVQMPDNKRGLADLSGRWVKPDIAAEINEATRLKGDAEKIVNRITNLWKIGKVTNPGTIARNFMSSGMLADFGGLSIYKPSGVRSYNRAVMGLAGRDANGAALVDEARKAGLFRSGWAQAEVNALADGWVKSKASNPILRWLDGFQEAVNHSKIANVYGSVDNFYKAALYIHGRNELGLNPQLAARYAKKYAIDYGDISPFVRFMREIPLGAPFITFASKAIPLTIETAVKHPIRFWKWPVAFMGIEELSQKAFEGERDQIQAVKNLGELRAPRYALLPTKDAQGRYQFLDMGYILPFGDLLEVFDKASGGSGANISFEPLGGPFQSLIEVGFNKSAFTGKPIYLDTDTLSERTAKISDYIGKALLPAWAPPIPGTGFRGGYSVEAFRKAIKPEFQLPMETPLPAADYFGRTRTFASTAASKIFGIDIKNVSLQDVKRAGLMEVQRELDQLSQQMARVSMMPITPEQKQAEIAKLTEKFKALGQEVREKFGVEEAQAKQGFTDDLGLLK